MQHHRSGGLLAATILAAWAWGCGHARTGPVAPAAGTSPLASAPSAPPAASTTLEIHEQVAGQVLTALGDHDFDAAERQFDDQMQRDVPKEKLSRVWSGAVAAQGELVSWTLVTRERMPDYDQLHYELKLEYGKLEALVTFGQKGTKVAGLYIRPPASP
jgi:hypothetical protein